MAKKTHLSRFYYHIFQLCMQLPTRNLPSKSCSKTMLSPCIAGTTWPNVQPVAILWSMLTATRCQEQRENAVMLTRTVETYSAHMYILYICTYIGIDIYIYLSRKCMKMFLCRHFAHLPTVTRSFCLPVAGTLKLQNSRL